MEPDLAKSLQLAGQNLVGCLNATQGYLPNWRLRVNPDYTAQFSFSWPAHNIGRWWDAMIRIERIIGFPIPEDREAAMLANLQQFFDNPDHLCFEPELPGRPERSVELHSLREGLLGLVALIDGRNCSWAVEKGRRMIATIEAIARDDGTWDLAKLDFLHTCGGRKFYKFFDPCSSHGRLIEALVWFHQATGDESALRLADRFSRFHFANTTQSDGHINPASDASHTHSYLGTLRGLLLFGKLTRQPAYVERVATTLRVTFDTIFRESGFCAHDLLTEGFGEVSSPGDAAQLALWLGLEGYPEFFDLAERLTRCRLIPSQIRQSPPLTSLESDPEIDLNQLIIGGFGGCHDEPHSHRQNVTDVTAAVAHSLADIYEHSVVRPSPDEIRVLFHLDYEDDTISVRSARDDVACLTVTIQADDTSKLAIRIPRWIPDTACELDVRGRVVPFAKTGDFLEITNPEAGAPYRLTHPLPVRNTTEKIAGTTYTVGWKGDDITALSPHHDFYPFYPPLNR